MNRKNTNRKKLVLTNDPSITAWGWAVVDPTTNEVVDSGAIKTKPAEAKLRIRKGDDRVHRVTQINRSLLAIIQKYEIAMILSELPHGSQSAVAATMIGMVTGVMQAIGDCLDIPVEWYSESDAKLAVSNSRSVPKEEMIRLVSELFPNLEWRDTKWIDEAVADSLAVFYVARQQSPSLKMLAVSQS
jgi:Holliday junction resolvasome RuvABC endonuclease subunit